MSKQERKSIFFTSDLHINHRKSIEFDNRPFKDVDHMTEVLVNNYNATVPEDGICYFLGDIGMGKHSDLDKIISRFNGTKVVVRGNHDVSDTALYRMGFDVVLSGAMIYIAGERVTMSHCPLRGVWREDTSGMHGTTDTENWHGEHRETHSKLTFADEGQFHLSGHIHSPNGGKSETKLGRQWDIGVVGNDFRPVSYKQVEQWIQKTLQKEKHKDD